jgi:Homeodomain-like domain
MTIRLHANATPKTRRYIQQSKKPTKALAKELGISVDTVRRWRKRDDIQEAVVVELRYFQPGESDPLRRNRIQTSPSRLKTTIRVLFTSASSICRRCRMKPYGDTCLWPSARPAVGSTRSCAKVIRPKPLPLSESPGEQSTICDSQTANRKR